MAASIPCGVCGLMMDYVYDKRVKYCTPACAKIAKKQTMDAWFATHKPHKEHICRHCLKPIECCGSRQRKYHPECAMIAYKRNKKDGAYDKRQKEELKSYSESNRRLRGKYREDGEYIEDSTCDGFTDRRVPDNKEDKDKSPFNLLLIDKRQMDKICRDVERLCQ